MRQQPQNSPLAMAVIFLAGYLFVYYLGGSARQLLFPVIWMVAFLHETGHAIAALVSGGEVVALQINPNGSGLTTSRGGNVGLILMGGYIGSAFLGNLLFYIGMRRKTMAQMALYGLAVIMAFSAIKWHSTLASTGLLFLYAAILFFIANRTKWSQHVVLFFGLASVVYIIQDFQVGPSSDLQMYEEKVGGFPAEVWKFIWLGIVVAITFWNLKGTFRGLSATRR